MSHYLPSDLNYGIRRAIVPAAGLGTRMRPLTNAIPKEMLPLGRKPLLEYIVDEIRDAGILQVLMVISPGKEMIERYFGDGHKFGLSIEYAIQNQMRGLGDAVLHGEIWCEGETFALVFGDCLIESPSTNVLSMMLQCRSDNSADGVVLTELVSPDRVNKYGILRPKTTTGDQFEIEGIAEKPQIGQAPSLNAVAARYILSSEIFENLRKQSPGSNGEIGLTEAVQEHIMEGRKYFAVQLTNGARRRDIGSWDTYLHAVVDYAQADIEYNSQGVDS